jgi:hypothetical protein
MSLLFVVSNRLLFETRVDGIVSVLAFSWIGGGLFYDLKLSVRDASLSRVEM